MVIITRHFNTVQLLRLSTSQATMCFAQSMYVRIKRHKTTIFLHVEPTDTVLEVKQKLQELTQQVCSL